MFRNIDSGLTDILMIIGRGKRSKEEHFGRNVELEAQLKAAGTTAELESIHTIPDNVRIHSVRQNEQRGLGDAIRRAQDHVGHEPFAVLLGLKHADIGDDLRQWLKELSGKL